MATFGDKDVRWFYVTMDDAFGVRRIESIGDIDADFKYPLQLRRTTDDQVLEGFAIQKLHGDKCLPLFFADVMNGADIGMVQCRGSFRFTPKALEY